MADNFQNYYQREDLWSAEVVTPHGAVAFEIIAMLPAEAGSILDVGCGNGAISNAISDRVVIGSDIALAAIKHMRHPACLADIGEMPFADNSFDLVMATDVLEHIPDSQYAKACAEIARISRRWILIAVPYRELLDSATVDCAACGKLYHVHWHQRSYDETFLGQHWTGVAPVSRWALAGGRWIWSSQAVLDLKHAALGRNYDFPQAVCPDCGTLRGDRPATTSSDERDFESLQYSLVEAGAAQRPPRSEILALFDKQALKPAVFVRAPEQSILPSRINARDLPRHENPVAYPTDPYVTDVREGSFVIVLPTLPSKLTCPGVSGAIYDAVEDAYRAVDLAGAEDLPDVHPTRFGYLLRVDTELSQCGVMLTEGKRPQRVLRKGPGRADAENRLRQEFASASAALEERREQAERSAQDAMRLLSDYEARIDLLLDVSNKTEAARAHAEAAAGVAEKKAADLQAGSIELRNDIALAQNQVAEVQEQLAVAHEQLSVVHGELVLAQDQVADLNTEGAKARFANAALQQRLTAEGSVDRPSFRDIARRYKRAFVETLDWVTIRRPKHQTKSWPAQVLVISHMYPRSYNKISGIFVHEQVKALRDQGVDVRVLSGEPFWVNSWSIVRLIRGLREYGRSPSETVVYEGVPVTYFPWFVGNWVPHWAQAWTYSNGLSRIWRDWSKNSTFGIVHAHTSNLDGTAARNAASRTGARLIVTEHMGPFDVLANHPVKKAKTRATLRVADRVFAVSSALRNNMIRKVGPAAQRVEVLGNGVDLKTFVPSESKEASTATRAIWIGHHVSVKRIDRLLAAFARAQALNPVLRLSLLGGGELLDQAVAQVTSLGIQDKVTFLPATDRAGVAAAIQAHDYVVISSETETFGLVALEAMACGKPVLSTACGGPQDVIVSDQLGLVVANSEDGLAGGLVEMANRAATFDAARIRAHVERAGSWDHVARSLTEAYAAALQQA